MSHHSVPGPSTSSSQSQSHSSAGPDDKDATSLPARSGTVSPNESAGAIKRSGAKANVSSACAPCKKAHLACDVTRPCKRCINMGKQELCEDVPHKKRGRPKIIKPTMGTPYARSRPATADETLNRWRPQSIDTSYSSAESSHPGQSYSASGTRLPSPPDPYPNIFTLFTSTDLKILRVSNTSYHLTGYHPHEFVNLNLMDWLHPADRQIIETERAQLLAAPFAGVTLATDRETQAAVARLTERELSSPAEGMREPYPHQNVRVVRSDHQYSVFNMRFHLGGGLGASLWRADSLSRIYLVISCLLIPPPPPDPRRMSAAASSHGVPVGYPPPTPVSATSSSGLPSHGLPSFSSIAAAAARDTPPQAAIPSGPLAIPRHDPTPPAPGSSTYNYPPSRVLPQNPPYYPRTTSTQSHSHTHTYQKRSSSPQFRAPGPSSSPGNVTPVSAPHGAYDYASAPASSSTHPAAASASYYDPAVPRHLAVGHGHPGIVTSPSPGPAPGHEDWRRSVSSPVIRGHGEQSAHGHVGGTGTSPTDYSRRPWET